MLRDLVGGRISADAQVSDEYSHRRDPEREPFMIILIGLDGVQRV